MDQTISMEFEMQSVPNVNGAYIWYPHHFKHRNLKSYGEICVTIYSQNFGQFRHSTTPINGMDIIAGNLGIYVFDINQVCS